MSIKEQIRAEIDKRYAEYRAKMKTDDFTYYEGMADALDLFEQFIDSLPDEPTSMTEEMLEGFDVGREVQRVFDEPTPDDINKEIERYYFDNLSKIARHFAQWGAEHAKKEQG